PPHAVDVDPGEVLVLVHQLGDLTGDAEAHGAAPYARYSMDSRRSSSPPVSVRSTPPHVGHTAGISSVASSAPHEPHRARTGRSTSSASASWHTVPTAATAND